MNDDLGRALDDLADAAARSASRGIVSEPAVGPTLSRLTSAVRRRRAAKAAGAGLLALALIGVTGGAVDAGWLDRARPAAPAPIATPVRTGLCGATTGQLQALAAALPSFVLTSQTASVVTNEDPFRFDVQVSSPTLLVATDGSSVVLVQHGKVVGAGFVAEPAETGLSDGWDGPAVVYDCSKLDGVTRTTTGRYEMWLVSQVTVAGQAPTRVARGPWQISLSPDAATPASTAWASPGPELTACGASDAGLVGLVGGPDAATITVPAVAPFAVDAAPGLTATVHNVSAETLALGTARPRVVLTKGHVVVGGVAFDAGSRGPAQAGESTDFSVTSPLVPCRGGSDALSGGGPALTQGDYEAFVLINVTPLGTGQETVVASGPFALGLLDPSSGSPLDSADTLFRCGKPLPFDEATVPQPGGLRLAADVPTTWAAGDSTPAWTAELTAPDTRKIDVTVAGPVELAFVGSDGLVKARTFTDAIGMQEVTVTSGAPVTLQGNTWVSACLPGGSIGGMITAAPLPAGAYTVWAFAPVTINHVTPDTGVPYEPGVIVVAVPPAATVTVTG